MIEWVFYGVCLVMCVGVLCLLMVNVVVWVWVSEVLGKELNMVFC